MKNYKSLIKEIKTNHYLTNVDENNKIVSFGKEEDAMIFYDENDAENILDFLNDELDGAFVLLKL